MSLVMVESETEKINLSKQQQQQKRNIDNQNPFHIMVDWCINKYILTCCHPYAFLTANILSRSSSVVLTATTTTTIATAPYISFSHAKQFYVKIQLLYSISVSFLPISMTVPLKEFPKNNNNNNTEKKSHYTPTCSVRVL